MTHWFWSILVSFGSNCPTRTCVLCVTTWQVFYVAASLWSLLARSESGAAALRWQKAGTVYHPATSPAPWLGWIDQLRADAPWHLQICHHRHKPPSIVKCQHPELAGVTADAACGTVQRERVSLFSLSHSSLTLLPLTTTAHAPLCAAWKAGVMNNSVFSTGLTQ